ncbi:hypothetical protein CPT_Percy35 [Caulobacter phage Percy]|uniref:Uncharacterized protein n=1 Tax=Caulobacter phage Percy TaxID=1701809 RepID=A0A0M3UKY8_9CAUD|nr:hypothetical protein CPT_Percy35 [Caulobacter phage Percy]ALF01669.1 hypothetical protein CPT_Percy35 [Caulobacter phage Percy]
MERRLHRDDYFLVRQQVHAYFTRRQKRVEKVWLKYVDLDVVMDFLFRETTNAWIVGGAYLVVYDIGTPWYANPDKHKFLSEIIVLALVPGGNLSAVPEFLERQAAEAGAVVAGAGTALAPNNRALARVYARAGFNIEAFILIKEITRERHPRDQEGG